MLLLISSLKSSETLRALAINSPSDLAISGIFFGPKRITARRIIRRISDEPISNMVFMSVFTGHWSPITVLGAGFFGAPLFDGMLLLG